MEGGAGLRVGAPELGAVEAYVVDVLRVFATAGGVAVRKDVRCPHRSDDTATPGDVARKALGDAAIDLTHQIVAQAHLPAVRALAQSERSPFRAWRHEHLFQPLGPGRTLMTDRVTYRLPLGLLGVLADRLVVGRQLAHAFAERHRRTRELLEARAREAAGAA